MKNYHPTNLDEAGTSKSENPVKPREFLAGRGNRNRCRVSGRTKRENAKAQSSVQAESIRS